MNTKIIFGLGTSVLLAASLLAAAPAMDMKQGSCPSPSCKEGKMMKDGKHCDDKAKGQHKSKQNFVKMFMKLDLTDAQRTQMHAILQESKKSMPNPRAAFSDEKFDKAQFVKLAKEKQENKIERKADVIEKVYNVLTPAQKKDFKAMLDKKMSCDSKKNCNKK
jgi:Spy/CpxP family protein refolding chaperone